MNFPRLFGNVCRMGVRNPQISAKIDDRTVRMLARIKSETGISEVEVIRALLNALCRHYEKFHSITLPIILNTERNASRTEEKTASAPPEADGGQGRKKEFVSAAKTRAV
ncbi:MAG: hypothetical protein LBI02_00235 [Opitutaceae bacterium]|jgi:hypothetical protein|nr:hypothetical protein [Opitutaceae bacterium]